MTSMPVQPQANPRLPRRLQHLHPTSVNDLLAKSFPLLPSLWALVASRLGIGLAMTRTDLTTNLPIHASLFTSFKWFSKNNKNEQPLLVSSMLSSGLGLQARCLQVMQPLCQGRIYGRFVICWSCTGYHSKDISSNGTKKEGIHCCRNATLGYSCQCKYQLSADGLV